MTETQIFQWLGITFFAMGIGMLTNPKFVKNIFRELESSTSLMLYGGLACLAIGFPLVAFYDNWDMRSSLIITLIGWLSLIKGLAFLMFPDQTMRFYKNRGVEKFNFRVGYFVVALGALLLYFGYFA